MLGVIINLCPPYLCMYVHMHICMQVCLHMCIWHMEARHRCWMSSPITVHTIFKIVLVLNLELPNLARLAFH